jgi:penicillin-binding protein 1C
LVIGMMSGTTELGPEAGYRRVDPQVAFKTGTSHGFRDAWAVGILGDHVLLVWLGNFNGQGNNALVARKVAAPLLFDLFARLDFPARERPVPDGVREVEICAASGQLPGRFCQHRKRIGFLPGVSPITACDLHREILVDGTTGLRVARDDGRPGLRREVREFWSPDMLELFRQAGLPRQPVPLPEDGVATVEGQDHGEAPRILSPIAGRTYLANGKTSISLSARVAPAVNRLYWFEGDAFLGSCDPVGQLAWTPSPGRHHIKALDDHGRVGLIEVEIKRE